MSSIRIRTVRNGKIRKLAVVRGKWVRFEFEAAAWHSGVELKFDLGYGVHVATDGVLFPTTCSPGEPLGNGLLATHTGCAVRVFIPLPDNDSPAMRVFDRKDRPVSFGTPARVKWRHRMVKLGRAILLRLLVAALLHLAGCSMFEVELPYTVPDAQIEPLQTSVAFPNQHDRKRLFEYAEANSPGLRTLRAAQKLALAGDQDGLKAIKDSLDTTNIGGVELPLKAIVMAVAMLWQWVAGGNEVQEEALKAQYEQARLETLHALNSLLNQITACWDDLDVNEARLFEARADHASTKLLVEKGLLAGADAHKELALERDRVERLDDERAKTKERKLRLTNEALALLGMDPWEGR